MIKTKTPVFRGGEVIPYIGGFVKVLVWVVKVATLKSQGLIWG